MSSLWVCTKKITSAKSSGSIHRTRSVGMRFGPDGGAKNDKVVMSVAMHVGGVAPETAEHVCAVPSAVLPFMNCTVPVGLAPVPAPATVAVSVTLPPEEMVVAELRTLVVVVWPTARETAEEVEVA